MKSDSYLNSFECFYVFLNWYYEEEVARGLSEADQDGLTSLLSTMKPDDEGYPIDMALWNEWHEFIHKIGCVDIYLSQTRMEAKRTKARKLRPYLS